MLSMLPRPATAQDIEQEAVSGEGIHTPPPIRYWPHDQEIRLGYRLIGDYETLLRRLRASHPHGLGANWEEDAFALIADVDVEALLLQRIDHYAQLTGLSVSPQRYDPADRWSSFDICIEVYLSDRREDMTTFHCLQEMHARLGSAHPLHQAFLPWAFFSSYSDDTQMAGASCLAAYSAFTFRGEIASDQSPRQSRIGLTPPFSIISGQTMGIPIVGDNLGFFGRTQDQTGRVDRRDNTPECRQALRDTYQAQIKRIIDACVVSSIGMSISDATPNRVFDIDEDVVVFDSRSYLLHNIGSAQWVALAGGELAGRHSESMRLHIMEKHAADFLERYYEAPDGLLITTSLSAAIQLEIQQQIDSTMSVQRIGLFDQIDTPCLGYE